MTKNPLTQIKVYPEEFLLQITLKGKFYLKKLYVDNRIEKVYLSFTRFYKSDSPPSINKYFRNKFIVEYEICLKFSKQQSHFTNVYGYCYRFIENEKILPMIYRSKLKL